MLTLLSVGPFRVHTFGISLALALIVGSFLFWKAMTKKGFAQERVLDLVLVSVLGGLTLGRVAFVLAEWGYFRTHLVSVFKLADWGLLWPGMAMGFFFSAVFFIRRRQWVLFTVADAAVGPLLIVQSLVAWGCFLGSCGSVPRPGFQGVIYAVLGLVFLYYWWGRSQEEGRLFFSYVIIDGLLRFIFEYYTAERILIWGVSLNHLFAVAMVSYGVVGWYRLLMKKKIKVLPKTFLEKIKVRLAREEKELQEQKKDLEESDPYLEEQRTEENAEPADDVLEDLGHDQNRLSLRVVLTYLRKVRQTLHRLRRGKYGTCAECGQAIDKARLEAVPTTKLCSKCAQREEERPQPEIDKRNVRRIE